MPKRRNLKYHQKLSKKYKLKSRNINSNQNQINHDIIKKKTQQVLISKGTVFNFLQKSNILNK